MNGQSIFASKEVKYLGVHFTRWGRTNQQVAHKARNASRALNVIKVVSAQPWANTPKIPVNVVRALVRSRLSYGLEAMPHLSKTGLARLTAIEGRGLRLALGLPQSVPQCLVYREAGLLPFRRHIQLVCSKYVFRCQTVDNSTVDEITATFRKLPSRLQSYSSICDLVCDLVRSAGLDGVEVATRPMHPYPPWLLERAHVEVDMEGLMKDQNPLVLAVTARLCLEEKYQHHLKIFTDGSVMEDVAAGAAFVIKVVSAQPWANTPKIPVNVVRALVRSRLSYGLEAMPHLSKTGLARLTAIEGRGLRLALGLPQSVPQCLVYREAGLLPFRRHIQLVCSKYVFRCQTVDNSTVDEITATFRKLPSRLQSYSSICDLVCDLVRSAGLDGVEVATRPMHPYPPWLLERAHVEVDMEGLMKDQNALVLAVTARLCLEEKYQHHLKIFTDGSVMEDVAAGAAFVIPEFNNLTHSYTLACPPGNLPRLEGYYYPPVVGPVSPTDKAIYGQGYIHQTQRPL